MRRIAIEADLVSGLSRRATAHKYNLHPSTVYFYYKRLKKNSGYCWPKKGAVR